MSTTRYSKEVEAVIYGEQCKHMDAEKLIELSVAALDQAAASGAGMVIPARDIMLYEIHSSWWGMFCNAEWARRLAAWYFAKKTNAKHGRYKASLRANAALKKINAI